MYCKSLLLLVPAILCLVQGITDQGEKVATPPHRHLEEGEYNKCEYYLYHHVWNLLKYAGVKFPDYCCLLTAALPPYAGSYENGAEATPDYSKPTLTYEQAELIVENLDIGDDYDPYTMGEMMAGMDLEAESGYGYGYCKHGYLKCQIIYGLMFAFHEGINACYCDYRSFVGCKCDNCTHPDLYVDESAAYLTVAGDHEEADYLEKLYLTRAEACVACPNPDGGGMPYEKCYGYCNIIAYLPYTEECFPVHEGEK